MYNKYWLKEPAPEIELALPIGNGRMGASIWGNVDNDWITINEEGMWYGGKRSRKNRYASQYLNKIRQLLLIGKVEDAEALCQMAMTGNPKYVRPYQMACDMNFLFRHPAGQVEDYRRELDMDAAQTRVNYRIGDTVYTREYFVSMKYQVLAMKLTAQGSHELKFQFNINRRPFELHSGGNGTDSIYLKGQCGDGVFYHGSALLAENDGESCQIGDYLAIWGAKQVILFFDFETSFAQEDQEAVCRKRLEEARSAGYETVLREHIAEYGALFQTMFLGLKCADYNSIPMDELLSRSGESDVRRYLVNMLFVFGRYLMISSSSNCELPANLQGIWCGGYTPRWESKYTININLQMNYWMVDSCGLSSCFEPFVKLLKKMAENGKSTAKEIYGCRGSVAHHNTECNGDTDLEGLPANAYMWPMGEAWLSLHLYEHYLYTLDEKFLRETAIPIMKESVLFFYDFLYRSEDGTWVTIPSVSPENTYQTVDGQKASVTMAPAMDNQILYELCVDYRNGCERSNQKDEIYSMAGEILNHLPPVKLTGDRRICEWYQDYQETEKGHRHLSHLFGLYPGNQIYQGSDALLEASKKTLDTRLKYGGGQTGWSRTWVICLYARLRESELVEENIRQFLKNSVRDSLLDSHPPFQIDGNFGFCAGIVETLAQKRGKTIYILPAISPEWEEGRVRGLRLKEGIAVDITWNRESVRCCIRSKKVQEVVLCNEGVCIEAELHPGEPMECLFQK